MGITTILMEGWRFVPHSYAIVNQWHCLELLHRQDYRIHMHDLPLYAPRWKPVRGLFDAAADAAIAELEDLPKDARADATLRLSVPVSLAPAAQGRTFVLGTADFGWLPRRMMEGGITLKQAHDESDAVLITPSAWSRRGLIRCGADPERVAVVPHGAETKLFRPAAVETRSRLRRALGWEGKFIFLNVSAMTRSKGPDILMKAFGRIRQEFPQARLILKGNDATYGSNSVLKRRWRDDLTPAERQACQAGINYMGNVMTFQRLAQLFQAADAYVSPYRSESFNMPVLEAIASGLPVICTEGGPTDDFTTPDFARRLDAKLVPKVRRKDPEEIEREPDVEHLTQLMKETLENDAFRHSARQSGPAFVRRRFTWRHAVDRLLEVMDC
jgi:glycosyltransferase involved in cell wall biosynthesis